MGLLDAGGRGGLARRLGGELLAGGLPLEGAVGVGVGLCDSLPDIDDIRHAANTRSL
jgi:hypothetical protein